MTHAISSHQISEKGLSDKNSISSSDKENNTYRQVRWSNTTRITTNAAIDSSKFSSLFNSLKDQYLINTEKQHKFRERLLKANHEAYDVEMSRTAKLAILSAWEKHTKEDEERYSDIIQKLKNDVVSQESRLSQLQELRQKTEKALRKGAEHLKSLENRMRSLAKDVNQNEVVDLLVRMAENDAEKMAITSDYSLQNLRIRKQENSLMKIHKYEQIADRLIAGDLNEQEREQILQEYRIIKNQLNYTLVPLKQDREVSWNSMLLHNNPKDGRRSSLTNTLDLGKTYTVADFQAIQKHKKEMLHLPVIDPGSSSDSSNEKTTETQSTVEQLPRLST
uniref:Uncharacterized protein n=1 Tax=Acrobeloides nanus TaxID=290746 RepID=A0A914CKE6_9BILA